MCAGQKLLREPLAHVVNIVLLLPVVVDQARNRMVFLWDEFRRVRGVHFLDRRVLEAKCVHDTGDEWIKAESCSIFPYMVDVIGVAQDQSLTSTENEGVRFVGSEDLTVAT